MRAEPGSYRIHRPLSLSLLSSCYHSCMYAFLVIFAHPHVLSECKHLSTHTCQCTFTTLSPNTMWSYLLDFAQCPLDLSTQFHILMWQSFLVCLSHCWFIIASNSAFPIQDTRPLPWTLTSSRTLHPEIGCPRHAPSRTCQKTIDQPSHPKGSPNTALLLFTFYPWAPPQPSILLSSP